MGRRVIGMDRWMIAGLVGMAGLAGEGRGQSLAETGVGLESRFLVSLSPGSWNLVSSVASAEARAAARYSRGSSQTCGPCDLHGVELDEIAISLPNGGTYTQASMNLLASRNCTPAPFWRSCSSFVPDTGAGASATLISNSHQTYVYANAQGGAWVGYPAVSNDCEYVRDSFCWRDGTARLCYGATHAWTFGSDAQAVPEGGRIVITGHLRMDARGYASAVDANCGTSASVRKLGRITQRIRIEGPSTDLEYLLWIEAESAASSGSTPTFTVWPVTGWSSSGSSSRIVSSSFSEADEICSSSCNPRCDWVKIVDFDGTTGEYRIEIDVNPGETWTVTMLSVRAGVGDATRDFASSGVEDACGTGYCPPISRVSDGQVDYLDYLALQRAKNKTTSDCEYIPEADLDGDGTVEESEIDQLICGQMADFDLDGSVDFFDLQAFEDAFLNADCAADVDQDGFVDFFDSDLFMQLFESTASCDGVVDCPPL